MKSLYHQKRYQQGATFIEILISIFVLAIGLLGQVMLQSKAMNSTFDSSQRSQAMWLAQEVVERIRVNSIGLEKGYYIEAINQYNNGCKKQTKPSKMCSDYSDNSGKSSGSSCSSEELAYFDAWELMCGYDNNTRSNLSDTLANLTAEITCDNGTKTANCPSGLYNVEVSWNTLFNKKISSKNKNYKNLTGKVMIVVNL
ncbi:type IV pilus modification protein PilV [Spartinivicinus poritis]|uniref:Type IV pilus modification protein PilV n=1 Tax=Spartinivicinus poritis TaxID=2994640 RepID=A0ABT5UCU7_9GAMM|nr:type IV pilus modification protein PilV [Spartinivicinus sp. A2-2]MDE1464196.1 type IV pilus modification protein PilV [Spartinivicinus sp. A2-2]